MVKKLVSNASGENYSLPIRVKLSESNSYIKYVEIPAYALNHEIEFNSEEQFKEWENMHSAYVNEKDGVIRIGKSSGHSLEKQNKDIEKDAEQKTESDKKTISKKESGVGVETEIEKVSEDNITKAKR